MAVAVLFICPPPAYDFTPAQGNMYKKFLERSGMAISPELMEILRCPKCKSKVELTLDKTGLRCTNDECKLVYPIRDDIPVRLVEEARVDN